MVHRIAGIAAAVATGIFASGAVLAADNGVYLGLGVEHSDFDLQGALDSTDNGLKLIAGLRLLDSFGVELNYADHGRATLPSGILCEALVGVDCPDTSRVTAKTLSAFAVGFLDFPLVDLFAKAGVARMDGALAAPTQPDFAYKDNGTDFAWGVGAQAHFASLGLRLEFEQFRLFEKTVRGVSASFVYTFL